MDVRDVFLTSSIKRLISGVLTRWSGGMFGVVIEWMGRWM